MDPTTIEPGKRLVFDVIYENGETAEYKLKPAHIHRVRVDYGKTDEYEQGARLVYLAAGEPNGGDGFADWFNSVDWFAERQVDLPPMNGSQPKAS